MDITVTCPNCGTKLTLFESQAKKKQGHVRCVHCGNRIKYDLTKPGGGTGYWPATEPAFKPGAKNKFLSIAKAQQKNPDFQFRSLSAPPEEMPAASRIPQAFDRSQNAFQKFDLKTGRILSETPAAETAPRPAAGKITLPPPAAPAATVKPQTAETKAYEKQPAAREAAKPAEASLPSARPTRRGPRAGKKTAQPAAHEMLRSAAPAKNAALTPKKTGLFSRVRSFFARFLGK